jgi:transposase
MQILKEEFHTLFEKTNSLGDGILELTDWLKKAQPYYKKSVETIKRWLGEIGGYFESRTTNGIVEGINTKLKLLKRCGFGFRNLINFEIRALLFLHFPKQYSGQFLERDYKLYSARIINKVQLNATPGWS